MKRNLLRSFFTSLFITGILFGAFALYSCNNTAFSEKEKAESDALNTAVIADKKDFLFTIETSLGKIKFILFEDTPIHRSNFLMLARKGYFDGTTFHRVINGFMIQGGDPNSKDDNPRNDGQGGPGYTLQAEIKHPHVQGAIAAARMGDAVNPKKESNGSQFYIVQPPQGTAMLDGEYTVFGQVLAGFEVVDAISLVPKDRSDRPKENIAMTITVEELKKTEIAKQFEYTYPNE